MARNDVLAQLIESGMSFTQMTQARAEQIVKDLTRSGDIRKKEAQRVTKELVDRGRESTEKLLAMVQAEVAKQVGRFAAQLDDVESRLEELAEQVRSHLPNAGTQGAPSATTSAGSAPEAPGPVPAKKTNAKKAPAKKAAVKKAPAKKAAVKKAPAKTAPAAKKAAAKKTAPASGTRRSSGGDYDSPIVPPIKRAAKRAPAKKKAAAKKAPATTASASALPSKKVTMGTRPAAKKSAN